MHVRARPPTGHDWFSRGHVVGFRDDAHGMRLEREEQCVVDGNHVRVDGRREWNGWADDRGQQRIGARRRSKRRRTDLRGESIRCAPADARAGSATHPGASSAITRAPGACSTGAGAAAAATGATAERRTVDAVQWSGVGRERQVSQPHDQRERPDGAHRQEHEVQAHRLQRHEVRARGAGGRCDGFERRGPRVADHEDQRRLACTRVPTDDPRR